MNKSYDPKSFEKEIYAEWLDKNYFAAKPNPAKKPFSIVMPPPNITGQLHMGHALNNTLQDALTRYKRMQGFEALWLPGTDHASIATEVKIVEKLAAEGKNKREVGREGFLKAAYEWNDKYGGRIVEQLKQLGCSCDWNRKAFTMDTQCSKAVREVFVRLYEKGLIYRGDRMINWCPECKTALSDAEVEHKESASSLWYLKYPVEDSGFGVRDSELGNKEEVLNCRNSNLSATPNPEPRIPNPEYITVATTRPETMLGDTAVAVNPLDKRYQKFIGKFLILPLIGRRIPVISDPYVDASFGTGAVKITPAHDPNDFEMGVRHNLERIAVMDDGGVMNENAGEYRGLKRFDARKKIVADLEKLGLLAKIENHKNNVGRCYRCDTVIEPLVSRQWFCKMEELAKPAIEAVVGAGETENEKRKTKNDGRECRVCGFPVGGDPSGAPQNAILRDTDGTPDGSPPTGSNVAGPSEICKSSIVNCKSSSIPNPEPRTSNPEIKFLPKRFEKIYLHWMHNVRDWCISRQLWWGHRIPAFYCAGCGEMTVSREDLAKCPKCGGAVSQDEDVLDTWFSSALWPFSTLGWPEKTEDLKYFYPTDVLVTAYDIIFFWVARMIFSGLEHTGQKPFSVVYINGLVRDAKGRKMSKSLNNGVDPLEVIDKYGTDPLRFSLLNGIAAGGDQRFSPEKVEGYRNFMNKIWNAARFVLMNCEDECSMLNAQCSTSDDAKRNQNHHGALSIVHCALKLSLADQWILTRLNDTIISVTKAMDKFEIGQAAARLYDFTWNEFCDWYIEFSKPALNSGDSQTRSSTQSVLLFVLREILKMLHPIIPFVTEEIYKSLPNRDCETIMLSPFPIKGKSYQKEAAHLEKVMDVIRAIRNLRAEKGVPQNKRVAIHLVPTEGHKTVLKAAEPYIEKMAGGSAVRFEKPSAPAVELLTPVAVVYIPTGDLIDTAAELARLQKELEKAEAELKLAQNKLNNPGFTAKAPKPLIDAEHEKLKRYGDLRAKLTESIAKLRG